ncbi:hypothetical protein [Methylobacterium nonmethylotrophicum]|uniref:hypothetical protein n=1 Tax=Methylobacterium nonmethylotrophicum TaxID=1141884 RepID=UPI001FE07FDA|nr:hypothetical protein [Methylobacterium nonmethylotrophicum]
MARERTEDAIDVLVAIMRDEGAPSAARVSAATAILDRGYGKPTQPLAGEGEDGEGGGAPIGLTVQFIRPTLDAG